MEKQLREVSILYKEDFDCQADPLLSGRLFRKKMAEQHGVTIEQYEDMLNVGFEQDE